LTIKPGQQFHLAAAVKLWPTPRASEAENRTTKPTPSQLAGKHGRYLAAEVQMDPTPRAIYGEHPGMTDPSHLTGAANAQQPGKLSADWVEALMNYPGGWTDLSDGDPDGRTVSPASPPISPTGPSD